MSYFERLIARKMVRAATRETCETCRTSIRPGQPVNRSSSSSGPSHQDSQDCIDGLRKVLRSNPFPQVSKLRDTFAAAALTGMMAQYYGDADLAKTTPGIPGHDAKMLARDAYVLADEMMSARLWLRSSDKNPVSGDSTNKSGKGETTVNDRG